MKKFLDKAINWLDTKLSKKARFILTHAIVAGILAGLSYTAFLINPLVGYAFTGFIGLLFKEIGEITGKEKAAGVFVNDLEGNLDNVKDALDDKWSLMQSVGATLLFVAVYSAIVYVV